MKRADFWQRNDKGCKIIATLGWDGNRSKWGGPQIELVKRALKQPFSQLDGRPFNLSKDWDKLEKLISGSRLWAVFR